jgi:hypothetical protein
VQRTRFTLISLISSKTKQCGLATAVNLLITASAASLTPLSPCTIHSLIVAYVSVMRKQRAPVVVRGPFVLFEAVSRFNSLRPRPRRV